MSDGGFNVVLIVAIVVAVAAVLTAVAAFVMAWWENSPQETVRRGSKTENFDANSQGIRP
jgi:flagellar basal body-associated protein FliL